MKFTKMRKEIILEAIAEGLPKRTAADLARITEKTLYEWINKGKAQEPPEGLEELPAKQLRARAKDHGIKGYSRMDKEALIRAIIGVESEYRAFYLDVKFAEAQSIREHVRNIKRAARENWQASGWYLERIAPEEFGKRESIKLDNQHSGHIDTTIHRDLSKLSESELITLEQLLSKSAADTGTGTE